MTHPALDAPSPGERERVHHSRYLGLRDDKPAADVVCEG